MQTRPTQWFDTEKMKPVYGIKVKHEDEWMDAAEDGLKPLFFNTEEERDAKRKELSKLTIPAKPVSVETKPLCATKGNLQPGGICGYIGVGNDTCGFEGKCGHQAT